MHPKHMTDSELYKAYCPTLKKKNESELSEVDHQIVKEYRNRFNYIGPFVIKENQKYLEKIAKQQESENTSTINSNK